MPCDQAAAVPSHAQTAAASATPLAAAPGSQPSESASRLISCWWQHAGKPSRSVKAQCFPVDGACDSKIRKHVNVIHRAASVCHVVVSCAA